MGGLNVLEISDASLIVDEKALWQELNLSVAPGEFVAIIGANGSGKTSLLKSILGQMKLTKGQIKFEGKPIRTGNSHIGYIPQQRTLEESSNVLVKDIVRFGLNGHKRGLFIPTAKANKKVDDALLCADEIGRAHV